MSETVGLWVGTIYSHEVMANYVGVSKSDLDDQVYDYVKRWWNKESRVEGSLPENKPEAIRKYFNALDGYVYYEFVIVSVQADKLDALIRSVKAGKTSRK